ncbi:MAG: PEGA domain-containing protein [Deltaproteobacteria bacterium]|nr:PEGA domain-containing protein [Deltaproteobacteria bacterium]
MAGERFGKYILLHKLATGGMAEIFLSRQIGVAQFEKLVVIKRILPHLSDNQEFVNMFLDEARIAAQLNHPYIVQIFDLGKIEGSYFIAMEYIHGEDLSQVVKQGQKIGRPLPTDHTVKIVSMVCEALYYAHTKTDMVGKPLNIVHRDISPQNIIVTYEGSTKLVDFGIAKAASQAGQTRAGVLKGKFAYMSPEQIMGEELDGRSDIFAVGIMLYELCVGRRLFKRDSEPETMRAITEGQVPPPRKINPDVPPELEGIIMKALATNRDERYPDARRMQMDLEGLFRKGLFTSSTIHISNHMKKIFKDKLKKQQKILEKAQVDSIDQLLDHSDEKFEDSPASEFDEFFDPNPDHKQGPAIPKRRNTVGLDLEPIAGTIPPRSRDNIPVRRPSGTFPSPPPLRKIRSTGTGRRQEGVRYRPGIQQSSELELDLDTAESRRFQDLEEQHQTRKPSTITTTTASRLTPSQSISKTSSGIKVARLQRSGGNRLIWAAVTLALLVCTSALGVVFWDNIKAALKSNQGKIITEGTVRISTNPSGASITLDDNTQLPQKTPALINLKLNETHYVKLAKEGYEDKVILDIKLTQKHPSKEIRIDLVPQKKGYSSKIRLRISSQPPGAQVFLDGNKACNETPCALQGLKLNRQYKIIVTKRGYAKGIKYFTPTVHNNKKILRFRLKPIQASLKNNGKPGILSIRSQPPGAEIIINGQPTGILTPADNIEIQPGKKVKIGLTLAGYKRYANLVILKGGKTRTIEASLKPLNPGKGKKPGYLTLNSSPPCDVYLDGRRIGRSPIEKKLLSSGKHTLRLRNLVEFLDRSFYLTIEPGKETVRNIRLRKGSVTFTALPGIEIYLGNQKLGQTPMEPVKLWEGEYVIKAVDTNTGVQKRQRIIVKPDKAQMIDIDLSKK